MPLASVLQPASAVAGHGTATSTAMAAAGLVLGGLALLLQRRAGVDSRGEPAGHEALRRSEATLNALIDALPVGVIVADAQGRVVRDNAATRELWGVPPETASWDSYGDWVAWFPETGERIRGDQWAMARALRFGETTRGQLVQNQPFGTSERRFYLQNVVPLRDAAGEIVGGVGAMLDVTDRLAAREALRESEARYRALFDHMAMGSCVCRVIYEDGRAVDYVHEEVNRAYEEQTGLRREDVLGRRLTEVIPDPADPARELVEKFGEVATSGRAVRYENEIPSLGRWFEGMAYCPKPGHFATLFLDVTDSRRAQAAVHEANARLRLALDAARMVAWEYDPATRA